MPTQAEIDELEKMMSRSAAPPVKPGAGRVKKPKGETTPAAESETAGQKTKGIGKREVDEMINELKTHFKKEMEVAIKQLADNAPVEITRIASSMIEESEDRILTQVDEAVKKATGEKPEFAFNGKHVEVFKQAIAYLNRTGWANLAASKKDSKSIERAILLDAVLEVITKLSK